jgi:hypothetical protein
MKKFKLNKQKLNLNKLTTPLLALSLMAGCAGLFGGNASAASVTNNIVFSNKLDPSASTMVPSTNTTPSAYLTQTATPFTVTDLDPNINFDYWFETQAASNPCTTTPIDVNMTLNYTSNYVVSNQDLGLHLALLDQSMASAIPPVFAELSPWYYYSPVAHTETINFNVPNVTSSNLYMLLRVVEPADGINHADGDIITVNSATYTLTYPDNMPDCTYPATNTPPTITSPSAVTIPSTTTSGSTVVPGSSLAATDTDGNTLSYSITAGNDEGYFAIDSNTGNITTTQTNIPAGTYTITVQVDDGNGGTATADVTITVTASPPTYYCPLPYDTTELLTSNGDCDKDGITNQTEGFDPNSDSNPADARDTDGDSIPDYLDLDSDNDGILDTEEKGTLANSSTNPSDVDSDGTPDFRDLDSDNDSTKDVLESGRNNLDTNNDGRIDGTTNTYGIPSSAASTTNPKALASTSLKDSDNNGTPDYRQSSRNAVSVLAKTGESLKTITIVAVMALGLAGYVKLKNKNSREQSYRRR